MKSIYRLNSRQACLVIVSAFYAYGTLVHVLNMLSFTGFDWPDAPLKWQSLDIIYLTLDVLVVIGLYSKKHFAVAAFYTAAISQIFLYTAFRSWIIDVPDPYKVIADQASYLTILVVFHVATLGAVTWALSRGEERR